MVSTNTTRLAIRTQQELTEQDSVLGEYERRVHKMNENVKTVESKLDGLQELRSVLLQVNQILQMSSSNALNNGIDPFATVEEDDIEGGKRSSSDALNEKHRSTSNYYDQPKAGSIAPSVYTQTGSLNIFNSLKFVVGVIERKRFNAFERVLWRAMRGNVYINKADIYTYTVNSATPQDDKCVFTVFANGAAAIAKIQKICTALGCRIFPEIGSDSEERMRQLLQTDAQINDLTSILFNTRQACRSDLSKISEVLEEQLAVVLQQKAIYSVMNLLHYDAGRKCLIGEAWCVAGRLSAIDDSLHRASERAGMDVSSILTVLKTEIVPPTHFPVNKYTQVFQDMNDSYGIADYREMNPAIFSLVTFPFLFSLMFGDVGHAIIMLIFAVLMVVFEKRLGKTAADSEMFSMIYAGRYIILLMSIFSIYSGFLYNDVLSKSVGLFPSMFVYDQKTGTSTIKSGSYVYPFGIDPLWNHAQNNLSFTNSVKMKLSIIFAVLHMNLGICVGGMNLVYEADWTGFFCHFLPQILFFNCLFGYMAFLIVWKWLVPGINRSILNTFITMIMQLGAVDMSGGGRNFFHGQLYIQRFLLTIAILCIPWMIFGKVILTSLQKRSIEAQGYHETNRHGSGDSLSSTTLKANGGTAAAEIKTTGREEEIGEDNSVSSVLIKETIHTIEFVLGTVSNTASYLRLWALSLAHAQLSEVLWSLCLDGFMFSPVMLVVGYVIWFCGSMAMMVAMEGLSAFLHALRLHWVEFNNKFYGGQGTKFEPFTLNQHTGESTLIPALPPVKF